MYRLGLPFRLLITTEAHIIPREPWDTQEEILLDLLGEMKNNA